MTKKFQLFLSEYGKAPEVVAVFEDQREARKYLTLMAAKAGYRRMHKDMWSKKEHKMFLKTYYPEVDE